jgi:hypothetical protein
MGMGFLYLIFCWTFIPAIIAFIEFILLISMDDKSFNVKYNRDYLMHSTVNNTNIAAEIEKLTALLHKNLISQSDFEKAKAKILM